MLKRHSRPRRVKYRAPVPHPVPVSLATPAPLTSIRGSALVLPDLTGIPSRFHVKRRCPELATLARELARLGHLQPAHFGHGTLMATFCGPTGAAAAAESNSRKPDSLENAVRAAFNDLGQQYLAGTKAEYSLLVAEDLANELVETNLTGSGIILGYNLESIVHVQIGPHILELENHQPGLGQTVLYWLHSTFASCTDCLDPIRGIEWASHQYWQSEDDESARITEELDYLLDEYEAEQKKLPKAQRKPFDLEAEGKKLELFRRADYDAAIPTWAGSKFKHAPAIKLTDLPRFAPQLGDLLTVIQTAAATLRQHRQQFSTRPLSNFHSMYGFSPYLLRWEANEDRSVQDPLAQIYDDVMNDAMNAGDENLDTLAAFTWKTPAELASALQRFAAYCQRIQIAENLLWSLGKIDLRIKITV